MPSSSRLLSLGALALSSSVVRPALASTQYSVVSNYAGQDFFNNFNFFTAPDPTNGFVQFVDQATAQNEGLINVTSSGSVYIGVDYTNTLSASDVGRKAVRIQSNDLFDHGLIIADIQHMPASVCGVWPAFWTTGKAWPAGGEIDIIEGVNLQSVNEMVLHTQGECTITSSLMSGVLGAADCALSSGTTGCVVQGTPNTYGTGLNSVNGGVYALLWTDEAIQIWFFPRSAIPPSITSGNPDPTEFGTPLGNFAGTCNIGQEFAPQQIIFDTTFCGDWAGNVFGSSGCPLSQANNPIGSCHDYVAQNPGVYQQAYWEINSLKLYQESNTTTPTSSSAVSSSSVATSSTVDPVSSSSAVVSSSAVASSSVVASPSAVASSSAVKSSSAVSSSRFANATATAGGDPPATAGGDPPSTITPAASASASAKQTITTVIVTTYTDVCPEGFTTKTITHTATYCPGETTSGIAPGFTTKTTVCTACAPTPTIVTLTVPITPTTVTATVVPAVSSSAAASSSSGAVPPAVSPAGSSPSVAPYPSSGSGSGSSNSTGSGSSSPSSGLAPVAPGSAATTSTIVGLGVSSPSATPVSPSSSSSSLPPVFPGAAGKVSASMTGLIGAIAAVALLA